MSDWEVGAFTPVLYPGTLPRVIPPTPLFATPLFDAAKGGWLASPGSTLRQFFLQS